MRGWAICLLVLALAGCGGGGKTAPVPAAPTPAKGAAPWPAPADPMKLTEKAGLTPETHEFLLYHVHAHLDVFVNGTPVTVPAGIGINIHDPGVHSAKAKDGSTVYGFIDPPCAQPCISPLHTHDISGILHTEAKKNQSNNLGEFFTEWNVRLDAKCVGGYCKPAAPISIYVDGDTYTGNPRQIGLEDLREIAIVIGTPPTKVPSTFPR
ncbi:MAG: hypothetical protein ACXVRS_09170 [Gaiellaceae bacterium]